MGSTIHGSENQSFGMQGVTRELARITQFKDTLSDFQRSPVDLIEKEKDTAITCRRKPVGRAKGSYIIIDLWQTKKVAFGHLRSSTFHNGKADRSCVLVNHRRLTNAVTTAQKDRVIRICNVRENEKKILEVNCHF